MNCRNFCGLKNSRGKETAAASTSAAAQLAQVHNTTARINLQQKKQVSFLCGRLQKDKTSSQDLHDPQDKAKDRATSAEEEAPRVGQGKGRVQETGVNSYFCKLEFRIQNL